ncbi:MAG: putative molybdenum cofactor guanylyltransferase [Syntrophorhabdus sp. PtaU1.Bin058]|nr:MAG: putative molybdenum cofactor guanylyltransferase [Syntrophorhabdus sp. PtaU1.Bin058]
MIKVCMVDVISAILAGGRNTRMGRDKATLVLDSELLIQRVYGVVQRVFNTVVVVSNNHDALPGMDVPIIRDVVAAQSPMAGIVSALMYTGADYVFALACDMPFLSGEAIQYMLDNISGEDIIIPKTEKGYEPLHAIYGRSCISYMLTLLERGKYKIRDILPYLSIKAVKEAPPFFCNGISVFTNVNTEEEFKKALAASKG